MSNSPKFMVFHLKELIYTFVFIILGILLIIMLVFMFKNKENQVEETGTYKAGVYTSTLNLSDTSIELKLSVDENHINSITAENVADSVTTMYPLVMPAIEDIANQIVSTQSTDNIEYEDGSMYTYTLLLNSIDALIEEAKVK